MTRSTLALFVLAASSLALVACESSGPPPAGRTDPVSADRYPQVAVIEGLDRILLVGRIVEDRSPDKPLAVTVPVRSTRTNDQTHISYRFEFFDADGRPLEQQMSWKYQMLPAQAQVFLEAAAIDDNAEDWRLIIQQAR